MPKAEKQDEKELEKEKEQKEEVVEEKKEKVSEKKLHPNAVAFSTKDKHTCIAVDALGHTPDKVERVEDAKNSLYYYFPATAWEDWDKYRRGEELYVLIHKYEDAEKRFRNNLYDIK